MAANLDDITWMGEDTKVEARNKLAKFAPKIGFTEQFETYDTLNLSAGNALGNAVAANDWAFRENLSRKRSMLTIRPCATRSCSQLASCSPPSSTSPPTRP
jgi:predicted metalloendopeptidase